MRFGRATCGDLEQAERREWWVSNGLGACAAGTVAGSLTRRYHGLLVAPLAPPLSDHLLDAGCGTVSEVFDGAPPHQPRGAPAQAWSVARTLEALWRLGKMPEE